MLMRESLHSGIVSNAGQRRADLEELRARMSQEMNVLCEG
jgi:hypothetical protein